MCDALPRDMEFNISFSKTISFSRCVFQHPRHCEERQRRSNPEFEKRLGCFVDVRNNKAFSRRAFAPESCQTAVVNRRHRFRCAPCQGSAGQCRWKHSQAPLWPWMTVRTKEKESEAERRQTQWSYSAGPYGPGRASKYGRRTSIGVPPRFSPRGRVVVLGSASGHASWDVACPSSGRYPPPACP